jgi:bifunctional UDP-N-acetylglucosamine pyrophosphorylase/glucosamine-1-phosphate N-acetyltransferase
MGLIAIVLAAGQGTRMKSNLPKVLHRASGRSLLGWALGAVAQLRPERTLVVVGYGAEQVAATLPEWAEPVLQVDQLGTGHAVSTALLPLKVGADDTVLITYGDMPLVGGDLLERTVEALSGRMGVLVTADLENPQGYGRIVRGAEGTFLRVVEEKDASAGERLLTEVNAGIYAFPALTLRTALSGVASANAQGEYYLPDVLPILMEGGSQVVTVKADATEVLGVNSHDQLAEAEALLRKRINRRWQEAGVWMQDPDRTYIDDGVELASGVRLYPGVHLEGDTRVGEGAILGPDVFAVDSWIGPGARVWYSVLRGARVGPEADVGPYASLRPGTILEARSKAGTFVEIKNTVVGEGAKVPHLAYMGDATVGARSNIGAGTITCNYDGYEKHQTVIGEDAFIGSDTMLVAPVIIGDKAVTGAGSVITRDVEPGALAIERAQQEEIAGYAARREKRQQARTRKE